MAPSSPFSWLDTRGWIVLAGAADALAEARALALSRADAGGAIAYISLAADLADALMDDMADLGAPAGYLVDLAALNPNDVYDRLISAGMIVLDAADSPDRLLRLLQPGARLALMEALDRGALLYFEAAALALAGEYFLAASGEITLGLNFVENALLLHAAGFNGPHTLSPSRLALPNAVCIDVSPGAALALGPEGQLETWGDADITISLADPVRAQAQPDSQ